MASLTSMPSTAAHSDCPIATAPGDARTSQGSNRRGCTASERKSRTIGTAGAAKAVQQGRARGRSPSRPSRRTRRRGRDGSHRGTQSRGPTWRDGASPRRRRSPPQPPHEISRAVGARVVDDQHRGLGNDGAHFWRTSTMLSASLKSAGRSGCARSQHSRTSPTRFSPTSPR